MGVGFSFKKKQNQKAKNEYIKNQSYKRDDQFEDDDLEDAVNLALAMQIHKNTKNIELNLSCINLPKINVFQKPYTMIAVKVKNNKDQDYELKGCTEIQDKQFNPEFIKTIIVQLKKDSQNEQKILFEVYNVENFDNPQQNLHRHKLIGSFETEMSTFAYQDDFEKPLKSKGSNGGTIKISALDSKIGQSKTELEIQLVDFEIKNHIYFTVQGQKHQGQYFIIHKSKPIKNNKNGCLFKPFKIKANQLSVDQQNLKFEFYELRQDMISRFLGDLTISIENLKSAKNDNLIEIFKNSISVGKLRIVNQIKDESDNFFNYIYSGYNLKTLIAVDFSIDQFQQQNYNKEQKNSSIQEIFKAQNKDKEIESLDKGLLDFSQPIENVWRVLKNFDSDEETSLLGYGAKMPPSHFLTSNCFSLNEDYYNPFFENYESMQKIIKKKFLQDNVFQMSSPSIVSEVVQYAREYAKDVQQEKLKQYVVLVILTKNLPKDIQQLKQELLKCQDIPISIVMYHLNEIHNDINRNQIENRWEKTCEVYDKLSKELNTREVFYWFKQQKEQEELEQFAPNILRRIPYQFLKYMKLKKKSYKDEQIVQEQHELDQKQEFIKRIQIVKNKKQNYLKEFLENKKKKFITCLKSSGFVNDIDKFIQDQSLHIYCEDMNIIYQQIAEIVKKKEEAEKQPIDIKLLKERIENLISQKTLFQVKTQQQKKLKKEDQDEKFLIERDTKFICHIKQNFPQGFYDYYHNIYQKFIEQNKKKKQEADKINNNIDQKNQTNNKKQQKVLNKLCQICYQNKVQYFKECCEHLQLCEECFQSKENKICNFCEEEKLCKQNINNDKQIQDCQISEDNSQSYEEFQSQDSISEIQ